MAALSGCSNKADDATPKTESAISKSLVNTTSEKSTDIFRFKADYKNIKRDGSLKSAGQGSTASRTYTNEEAYEIGRKRGAADVLALANQFSYPCPDIPAPGTGENPSNDTPNDTSPPVAPEQGQGGNALCMDGYDRQRLDEAIIAWRNAAQDLVNTSTSEEEQWYYMGYAQGVLEWELPPR